ncbi:MAG: type II secretion system protein [Myxococcota bacterium]|jgi:prepilin-type N-terminal cleavage/methylation domain-containing protein
MPTSATGTTRTSSRPVRRSSAAGGSPGFTLIEILAVIVIMGAMLMLVLPNLGVRQASALRDQARTLAGRIELTRQLAIVSGKPHRLLIDLEAGTSSVERFDRGTALDEENAAPDIASDYDLLPPTAEIPSYTPVNSALTESETLGENFFFEGIQTADGWIDDDLVQIVFDADGTTDAAELVLSDLDGRLAILEVRPLLDRVAIREEAN